MSGKGEEERAWAGCATGRRWGGTGLAVPKKGGGSEEDDVCMGNELWERVSTMGRVV